MMSAWPDMKMSSKPLGGPGPITSSTCFSGRYSPTYRVPEHQMKRCNNTVSVASDSQHSGTISKISFVLFDPFCKKVINH